MSHKRKDQPIKLCIESDPPSFNKKERLNENMINDHIIKSSRFWLPKVTKRKVNIFCLCSSAENMNDLKRVAYIVDLVLLYIRHTYLIYFGKNYLISPKGFRIFLYKSCNDEIFQNNDTDLSLGCLYENKIDPLLDIWISSSRSETIRFFTDYNNSIDPIIGSSNYKFENNKEYINCFSRIKIIPQFD
uniref:Uncharacterized protein n=1 Tax=Trachysalambria curvirostris majanivirus TaxID=2984281 RepID=A0A9C7CE47_9VIRU|nr:MAG: hypothetical protein [Trachysalambria curvirostris majanivirus]